MPAEAINAMRRRAVKFIWFALSTASFQATRLAAGLVAAAVLPPVHFAYWGLILIALSYSNYLNLGLLSSANREIPILIGRGAAPEADEIESIANGAMIVLAVTVGILAVGLALTTQSPLLLAVGFTLAVQQLYLLQQVALKARLQFNRASTQQTVLAVAFAVVSFSLLRAIGVGALVLGQAMAYACAVLIVAIRWPPKPPRLAWSKALGLAVRGLPIMAAGFLFAALSSTDRWFVFTFYGQSELGKYTLASVLSSSLLFVALLVAQQSYPRLAMNVGRDFSKQQLIRQASLQSILSVAITAPVSILVVVAAPRVVPALFPSYASSVAAIQVLAVGMLPLIAATGFANLLVAMGRAWLYLGLVALSIAVQGAAAWIFFTWGLGLQGVAFAATLSYAVLMVGSFFAIRNSW